MSIISRLFRHQPNALQVSDWLGNMQDAFIERSSGLLDRDNSSPDMLVFFTLMNSTLSTNHILHQCPSILSFLGAVYGEMRAYYECLWQLVLLGKHDSRDDQVKISKLYADVKMGIDGNIQTLFSDNPNIKRLLASAFDNSYDIRLCDAVKEYIWGQHSDHMNTTDDTLHDNVESLTLSILKVTGLRQGYQASIKSILVHDTNNALCLKFLTQFDLERCKFIEFPDDFYK